MKHDDGPVSLDDKRTSRLLGDVIARLDRLVALHEREAKLTLGIGEAAEVLDVSYNTILRMIERDELPVLITQTAVRKVPRRALEEWVDSRSGRKGDAA